MTGSKPLLMVNATQEARRRRDFFLKFILGLLVFNMGLVVLNLTSGHIQGTNPRSYRNLLIAVGNLLLVIGLVLNHFAFQYQRPGGFGKAMKALAVAWFIPVLGLLL
ncbi:MAG: hypothetical protein AABZ01_05435, partial [Gemmatimonadota bacterium]